MEHDKIIFFLETLKRSFPFRVVYPQPYLFPQKRSHIARAGRTGKSKTKLQGLYAHFYAKISEPLRKIHLRTQSTCGKNEYYRIFLDKQ